MNTKKILRDQADALWKAIILKDSPPCESCGRLADRAHHYFPKAGYNHLRYELKNGIPLCNACHIRHHLAYDPCIHLRVQGGRSLEWLVEIMEMAADKPHGTYIRVSWYEDKIKELEQRKDMENDLK